MPQMHVVSLRAVVFPRFHSISHRLMSTLCVQCRWNSLHSHMGILMVLHLTVRHSFRQFFHFQHFLLTFSPLQVLVCSSNMESRSLEFDVCGDCPVPENMVAILNTRAILYACKLAGHCYALPEAILLVTPRNGFSLFLWEWKECELASQIQIESNLIGFTF